MPSFAIFAFPKQRGGGVLKNDESIAKWNWRLTGSKEMRAINVETVECIDMINNRTDLTDAQREKILDEFTVRHMPSLSLLCPKIDTF